MCGGGRGSEREGRGDVVGTGGPRLCMGRTGDEIVGGRGNPSFVRTRPRLYRPRMERAGSTWRKAELSSLSALDGSRGGGSGNVREVAHVQDASYTLELRSCGLDEVQDGAGGFATAPSGVDFNGCLRLAEV